MLPDGHVGLELIDELATRNESLGPVRSRHGNHNGQVAYREVTNPMDSSKSDHVDFLTDTFGHRIQLRLRGRVRRIAQHFDLLFVINIADGAHEYRHSACGGIVHGAVDLVNAQRGVTDINQSDFGAHRVKTTAQPPTG